LISVDDMYLEFYLQFEYNTFFFFFFLKKKKFKESEVAIKWCMVDLSLFLTNFFFFGGGNYGKVKIGDLCVVMFVSYSD
jgi:hypothetical protein